MNTKQDRIIRKGALALAAAVVAVMAAGCQPIADLTGIRVPLPIYRDSYPASASVETEENPHNGIEVDDFEPLKNEILTSKKHWDDPDSPWRKILDASHKLADKLDKKNTFTGFYGCHEDEKTGLSVASPVTPGQCRLEAERIDELLLWSEDTCLEGNSYSCFLFDMFLTNVGGFYDGDAETSWLKLVTLPFKGRYFVRITPWDYLPDTLYDERNGGPDRKVIKEIWRKADNNDRNRK